MPANKLLPKELNQSIGIELATESFLEHFGSKSQFPDGTIARFSPLSTPTEH